MKTTMPLFCIIFLILIIQNSSFAQTSFTPLFDRDKSSSVHIGTRAIYYKSDHPINTEDVDVTQLTTTIGMNFEERSGNGFWHIRGGYSILGKSEYEKTNETEIVNFWKDYQDYATYFGTGYIYFRDFELSDKPIAEDNYVLFTGLGFDINANLWGERHTKDQTSIQNLFYFAEIQIIAIAGMRIPDTGFTFSISFSYHHLLTWESKSIYKTNSLTTVTNASSYVDLVLPSFGIETYITYDLPSNPYLRFGISGKFINSLFVTCFAGYLF